MAKNPKLIPYVVHCRQMVEQLGEFTVRAPAGLSDDEVLARAKVENLFLACGETWRQGPLADPASVWKVTSASGRVLFEAGVTDATLRLVNRAADLEVGQKFFLVATKAQVFLGLEVVGLQRQGRTVIAKRAQIPPLSKVARDYTTDGPVTNGARIRRVGK